MILEKIPGILSLTHQKLSGSPGPNGILRLFLTRIPEDEETETMRAILLNYVSFEMDILMRDSALSDLLAGDEILNVE